MPLAHPRSSAFIGGLVLLAAIGCTHEASSSSMHAEQDKAIKDPFGYGPTAADLSQPGSDVDPTNISGGGMSNYDKKAMKRDLDAVFGP